MKGFLSDVSTADIQREKNRARELRRSEWWKRKRSSGFCHYCQRSFPPTELTMDHLVPLARGGKSTKGNLVPCCKECNTKKKYALPWETDLAGAVIEEDDTQQH
ncbi:MAG: HNH endonuclease [Candidatus Binatia bacterium]